MKERPILFSAPMVKALLAGTKTQTRRLIRIDDRPVLYETSARGVLQPGIPTNAENVRFLGSYLKCDAPKGSTTVSSRVLCPYGIEGDRLWVREQWHTAKSLDKDNATQIAEQARGAGYSKPWAPLLYNADGERQNWQHEQYWGGVGRQRAVRFMPRWASRLTLEVTSVRVERLQDISEADATAEGVSAADGPDDSLGDVLPRAPTARDAFAHLWDAINGAKAPWSANPWVWAISFRRIEQKTTGSSEPESRGPHGRK